MRHLKLTIALLISMCLPALASAAMISASYQVNLNDSDPGLVVDSADYAANPFSFDLNAGERRFRTLWPLPGRCAVLERFA